MLLAFAQTTLSKHSHRHAYTRFNDALMQSICRSDGIVATFCAAAQLSNLLGVLSIIAPVVCIAISSFLIDNALAQMK